MKDNAILYCENLKKEYYDANSTVQVLQNINLRIGAGECVAIVGRSGSGKTTLLNMLGGLEAPTSGNVVLDGTALNTISEHKRGFLRNRFLGLIFQFHHLLPEFTALENVCMPLLIRGTSVKKAIALSTDLLEKVSLGHRLQHKPGKLSGGERQRVAIARALVTKPKCILADEPTGNLDNQSADQVYNIMMELVKDLGTSFVVVTHDLSLASKMDRTVTLERGILREGS